MSVLYLFVTLCPVNVLVEKFHGYQLICRNHETYSFQMIYIYGIYSYYVVLSILEFHLWTITLSSIPMPDSELCSTSSVLLISAIPSSTILQMCTDISIKNGNWGM